ncbi:Swarming motility protein SwrC [Limihaloglobus sulfuriphilus]|uniref:Swarming motility protein SwrC n=1 Tax=Limihaloglobus sulfuriphilus TaxID=1851148 RepID=A0A1Q2MFX7_9BACT|nr:efflux RND transporter permease subunit [Limihaloglobus sulfuriphilus]AQQ71559.1 Swarming motility protein SwrC [Limihaloglobus sulfuriphilus]
MPENLNGGSEHKGLIAWMTYNRVTPNLCMLILLVGGFLFTTTIKQEVFPEFSLDIVTIRVPYPGSSPEEVEQGIILVVEEAIRGLDGVKEITAVAGEGSGTVTAELEDDADPQRTYQDIKQEIDRITTFPLDAEEPQVSLSVIRREVLDLQIYGDVSEWALREIGEQVRDELLQNPEITQVDLEGVRDYEVKIQIDQQTLRAYGLTLNEVAQIIRSASVELPGGYIETSGGDLLLRVKERRDWADEFANIPIITTGEGSVVQLGDIALVRDDFEDSDRYAYYNGMRAVSLDIFRVGSQTPIGVAKAAKAAMKEIENRLPPGVDWAIRRDMSDIYRQRLELLLTNAGWGLLLVLMLLGLFLELKLAFWVTLGIPISFLGAFLFLPLMGVTINMISMFAFIVALGIVVDDAIVVGENIYEYRTRGMKHIDAAIKGAQAVKVPVVFSVTTNIIAFLPLCFIPGTMGKIWKVIPFVVMTVFAISLFESLVILPAHLAHSNGDNRGRISAFVHRLQQGFSRKFIWFVEFAFAPVLDFCIKIKYIVVAAAVAVFILILGYVNSGRIGIIQMPRIEADFASVTATLPYGSPLSKIQQVSDYLLEKGRIVAENNGGDELVEGFYSRINDNSVSARLYLTDAETRPISTTEVTNKWRELVGPIPGTESVRFESDRGGPGSGAAITVELSHRNIETLDQASQKLAEILEHFPNVKDIDDGYSPGKQQLDFKIKPQGQSLGLTAHEIARQVRYSFYGAEALRQQRGRNEIKVRVRLPIEQRNSEYDIETLLIRTPAGTYVPLREVAEITRGRAYTTINRRNAGRTVTVTANIEPISQTSRIMETLETDYLPQLVRDFPGLSYRWEGRQADMSESMTSLFYGFIFALMCIYAMLAIPFKSYSQPLIVMIAIPFGIIGAVIGHIIMGYSVSIMSMMGIVALSGVVVNDSLVLIDYANNLRRTEGLDAFTAIHQAGVRRFRPILLTTLTTFGGLTPMIFETSRQARFMIPMAISLGFGILFATLITLVLVPCLYMVLDSWHKMLHKPAT